MRVYLPKRASTYFFRSIESREKQSRMIYERVLSTLVDDTESTLEVEKDPHKKC